MYKKTFLVLCFLIIIILYCFLCKNVLFCKEEFKERIATSIKPNNISTVLKLHEIQIFDILNEHKNYSFVSDKVFGFKTVPYLSTTMWFVKKVDKNGIKIFNKEMTKQFHVDSKNKLAMTNSIPVHTLFQGYIPGGNRFYLYYIIRKTRKRMVLTYNKERGIIAQELLNKTTKPLEFELFLRSNK